MKQITSYFSINGYTVTLATSTDAPELIKLINHAFAYQDANKGQPRVDESSLFKKMAESYFLVWRTEQYIAACCYIERKEGIVHFGLLCVADNYKGGKLAPTIIGAVEAYARDIESPSVQLDYMSQSPWLKQYYERFGFEITGNVRDIGWSRLIAMEKLLT